MKAKAKVIPAKAPPHITTSLYKVFLFKSDIFTLQIKKFKYHKYYGTIKYANT